MAITPATLSVKVSQWGLFDFAQYEAQTLSLPNRFVMALASDGILEALPQANLAAKCEFMRSLCAETVYDIDSFSKTLSGQLPKTPIDDITLLQIRKREKNR